MLKTPPFVKQVYQRLSRYYGHALMAVQPCRPNSNLLLDSTILNHKSLIRLLGARGCDFGISRGMLTPLLIATDFYVTSQICLLLPAFGVDIDLGSNLTTWAALHCLPAHLMHLIALGATINEDEINAYAYGPLDDKIMDILDKNDDPY